MEQQLSELVLVGGVGDRFAFVPQPFCDHASILGFELHLWKCMLGFEPQFEFWLTALLLGPPDPL